ncbi:MAG: RNA methyltransferase [Anaerolineae bacterium]|jgi:TrmH family RNA methyltransferase|nr:RNA methyltransferase [Anaerolineae bacterium]
MNDVITSLQNTRVKLAAALQKSARARRQERKIPLEGARLIRDALLCGHVPDFVLYDLQTADYELVAALQATRAVLMPAAPDVIKHASETQQPQGMIAVFPLPMPRMPRQPGRILILDAVREPGNMGTLLRTAAAAGVEVVLLAPECVDPYNPKVLRAGMGAHFRLPLVEAAWTEIATYCEAVTVYLAAGDAEQPYSAVDWRSPHALIIGNEAHGARPAARLNATRIAIPMAAGTESLNAAMAATVILFEAQRQHLAGPA